MKNKTLEQLINKKDFYYVNENLTTANFPAPEKIQTENWKIIKIDRTMTSEEVLAKIKSEGCRPANVYELATWFNSNKEKIEKGTWLVALGQTAKIGGYRGVPNVNRNSDGDFKFNLGHFEGDWGDDDCLLCFCDSSTLPLSTSEESSLTLESAIAICKANGLKVVRTVTKEEIL